MLQGGFAYLRGVIRSGNVHGVDVVPGETLLEYLVYLGDHRYHEYASIQCTRVALELHLLTVKIHG